MRSLKFLLFFCLISTAFLHSYDFVLEGKVGYYYPTNQEFREMTDEGGYTYGLEAFGGMWGSWKGFFAVDYFCKEGVSSGDNSHLDIRIVPISAGVRYDFCRPYNIWNPYLAAGVTYHFLRIKDKSEYGSRKTKKSSFGATGKMGIFVRPYSCLVVDLFFDYTYNKMSFGDHSETESGHDIYLSGIRGGVGLGWEF